MIHILKSAFYSFKNFKIYTFINLFGLILGISCSLVIILYVSFEFSFDNFHRDKERIFRVNEIAVNPQKREVSPSIRVPYGPALKNEISEIEDVVRIRNNWHVNTLKYADRKIDLEKVIFADSNLFDFFSFEILQGKPNQILRGKNSIVLTKTISERLFGTENPLGKMVEYDNNSYIITGIAADIPLNSHIRFEAVFPIETLLSTSDQIISWDKGISANTYVKLFSSDLKTEVNEKLPDFLWEKVNKKNKDSGSSIEFYLESISQIHLFSKVDWDPAAEDGTTVIILMLIGCLILLIGIINYLFISSGILTLRLKYFRIKHYFGFIEYNIAKQLFTESLLLFVFASVVSVILIYELRNSIFYLFNADFVSYQLEKNIFLIAIAILVISSITGFIQFVDYKRKMMSIKVASSFLTPSRNKSLIYISAFQFFISIGLISSLLIVYNQLNLALHGDLGFKVDNILNISHGSIGAKQQMLIEELNKLPGVSKVSASFGIPGLETAENNYQPEGEEQPQMFSVLFVDDHFFETFQLEMVEGRNFRKGDSSDTKAFIVNQTLLKQLNWESAVGKSMYNGGNHEIIGVVKDFHVGLIYSKIPPLIISKEYADAFYSLSIALIPGQFPQTLKKIEELWNKMMPGVPFKYSFMDAKFESLYKDIERTATILFLFTSMSILISILGLFGISFLLMNSMVKQIGIRKVNGATTYEIVKMLNFNFLKWVLIAFVVAVPIAWIIMNRWLQSFAYKTEISWWIFALAGMLVLAISILTVSWQSWRVASRNPVDALRYE